MSGRASSRKRASESSYTFKQVFQSFARFGDPSSIGDSITLTQIDRWFRQANMFGNKINTTDTAIGFNKYKLHSLGYKEFLKFLADLSINQNIEPQEIFDKLSQCQKPCTTNTTVVANNATVRRLTDTSHYTGVQRQRFNDDGTGRGSVGNKDPNIDYVRSYSNKKPYESSGHLAK